VNKYKSLLIVLFICVVFQQISVALVKAFIDTPTGVFYVSLLLLVVWIPLSVWIYNDSKKNLFLPWLWALLVLFLHSYGLIIYLLVQLLSQNKENNANR